MSQPEADMTSPEADIEKLYVDTEQLLRLQSPVEVTLTSGISGEGRGLSYRTIGDRNATVASDYWAVHIATGKGEAFIQWKHADYATRIAGARMLPKLVVAVREQRERLDAGAAKVVHETREALARLNIVK